MYSKVLVVFILASTVCASVDNNLLAFGQQLQRLLNSRKSPCQDFYGYVCDSSAQLQMPQIRQQQQQRFQQLLNATNPDQLLNMEQQLINFYKSCQYKRDTQSLRSSDLYRNTCGWPALEHVELSQRCNQSLNWLGMIAHFHEIGASYFFETRISMQSNKRLVTLQPDVTRRHTMRKFEQRVGEIMNEFGVEQSRAHVASLAVLSLERLRRDIIKVERIEDQVQFSYANFKRSSFGNVSLSHLDWDAYFRKLLGGKTLKPTDTIVVKQLPRLVDYFKLLQNTSMHRLLNWIWIDYLMDIAATDCQQLVETYAGDIYAHLVQRVSTNHTQMAQMYSAIGKSYKSQLSGSVWIDEISEQASQRFLGHIMHLMLNGDERLNAEYDNWQLTKRSFYSNMEKLRRFQHKRQIANPSLSQQLRQYAQIFDTVNAMSPQLNLSAALNYVLVGERFARSLIAAGSSSRTPGAWRSMDSERQFAAFQNCSHVPTTESMINANELLLGMLAQRQALSAYKQWLGQQATAVRLSTVGRMQLTLQQLYFVGSLLVDCRENQASAVQQERKRQLQHAILRNSPEFTETFACRSSDALYAQQQRCKLNTSA